MSAECRPLCLGTSDLLAARRPWLSPVGIKFETVISALLIFWQRECAAVSESAKPPYGVIQGVTSYVGARLLVLPLSLFVGSWLAATVGPTHASADVGDLGPPPAEQEIKQTIADMYTSGQPLGTRVDIQFDGPITVGAVTEHERPADGWCATCHFAIGQRYVVSSAVYPVFAVVKVATTYGFQSSSITPSGPVETTHDGGVSCRGGGACPYYFYRDAQGNWQAV